MVTPRDLARLAAQRGAERESRAELAAAQRQWLDWISSPRSPLPLRSPRSAGSGGGAATASRSSLGGTEALTEPPMMLGRDKLVPEQLGYGAAAMVVVRRH